MGRRRPQGKFRTGPVAVHTVQSLIMSLSHSSSTFHSDCSCNSMWSGSLIHSVHRADCFCPDIHTHRSVQVISDPFAFVISLCYPW